MMLRGKKVREFVRAWRLFRATTGRDWAHQLVDGLNTATKDAAEGDQAASPAQRRDVEAWREIAGVLLDRLPQRLGRLSEAGCRRFNRLASECPGVLTLGDAYEVDEGGARAHLDLAGMSFTKPGGFVCYLLWNVREAEVLDRVKQCAGCGKWFVDETRNKSAARCSPACTGKWWDRSRRRAAGHSQYQDSQSKRRQRRRNP